MPLSPEILEALRLACGVGQVLTAVEDLIPYGFDGTAVLKQLPGAVVFPNTPEQVAACVRLAAKHSLPVVTRGSGTG